MGFIDQLKTGEHHPVVRCSKSLNQLPSGLIRAIRAIQQRGPGNPRLVTEDGARMALHVWESLGQDATTCHNMPQHATRCYKMLQQSILRVFHKPIMRVGDEEATKATRKIQVPGFPVGSGTVMDSIDGLRMNMPELMEEQISGTYHFWLKRTRVLQMPF